MVDGRWMESKFWGNYEQLTPVVLCLKEEYLKSTKFRVLKDFELTTAMFSKGKQDHDFRPIVYSYLCDIRNLLSKYYVMYILYHDATVYIVHAS